MRCEEARRYFTALGQGELEEEQAQQVQAHLDGCEGCAADVRQMEVAVALLHSLEPEDLPERFPEGVIALLPMPRGWQSWGLGWKFAWAGGTVVVAGIFLGLGMLFGRVGAERRLALAPAEELARVPPAAVAQAPSAPEGYSAPMPMEAAPPPQAQLELEPGALGPFVAEPPPSRREAKGAAEGYLADIEAPLPARRPVRRPEVVAAAPTVSGETAAEPFAPSTGFERRAADSSALAVPRSAEAAGVAGAALMAPVAASAPGAREADVAAESSAGLAGPTASEEKRFDLRLEGADLVDALRLIASTQNRSLVVGPGVTGTVTVRMRNVTAEEAVEKLSKEFNLSVKETGETMVVMKVEESSGTLLATGLT